MAETSTMLPLGTKAPNFTLLDTISNKQVSLNDVTSSIATVIMFLCNHCPYVKYIQPRLLSFAKTYQAKGISFVGISSNDATTYPQDGPEAMAKEGKDNQFPFPYLYDETQAIAKAYHAACTPEFYVFDKNLLCVYRGRFDDSTPRNNHPTTGLDLQNALDNLIQGKTIDSDQKPSIGCSIKWK